MRVADSGDRPTSATGWMLKRLRETWGESATIVGAWRRHDLAELPAFIAPLDGDPAGIAIYPSEADECELVTLDALVQGRGMGSALLEARKLKPEIPGMGAEGIPIRDEIESEFVLR